jgi:glycosyltransferase involved in cell wall biosynthesis
MVPRVVCATASRRTEWRWFESAFAGRMEWEFFHSDLPMTRQAWRAAKQARHASLLITHDPKMTARCALFARLQGVHTPHVAWSFNFSTLPTGFKRFLMTRAFTTVDRFVVYSTMEKMLYSDYFSIAEHKIDVELWGGGQPVVASAENPIISGDYICAIGGNSRDYATLMMAMAQLPDIPLVAVMRPSNVEGLTVPPNVIVKLNAPLEETNNILKFGKFMVLPLNGKSIPCGHVTLVIAMHLGKAIIVTDSTGVADYVRDGENAILCKANSVSDLAVKIRRLWEDSPLCEKLGTNGRLFATTHCSEEGIKSRLRVVLHEYLDTSIRPMAL